MLLVITNDTTDWYCRTLLFSKPPWRLKIESKASGFAVDTIEPVTDMPGSKSAVNGGSLFAPLTGRTWACPGGQHEG